MLKKALFVAVFLGMTLAPALSYAQTVDQPVTLDSLRAELIQLLTQEITVLQAQLAQMQADTSKQISDVSAKVDTVISNQGGASTGPVISTPASVPVPQVTVTLGDAQCDPDGQALVKIPVTVQGTGWDKIDFSYDPYALYGGAPPTSAILSHERATTTGMSFSPRNIASNPNVYIFNTPAEYHFIGNALDSSGNSLGSFAQTVTVTDKCPTTVTFQ